jgi:biopolymer transport protein ExbB/biopolymer transport protein TolQ
MNPETGIIEQMLRVALLGSEWVLYLLLVLSVASFAVVIERWWWFRRQTRGSRELTVGVRAALISGDAEVAGELVRRGDCIEARILQRAWRWLDAGPDAMADAIESELSEEKEALERGLNLLGTLGNNAPFVGLLGTVIGVIGAFHALGANTEGGGGGNMDNVMAAIAEALVATGVGLFVALPAVVAYNKVQTATGEIEARVLGLSRLVTAHLHARAHRGRDAGER